eukprot:695388-Prorocentrum_minimum.AAC.1
MTCVVAARRRRDVSEAVPRGKDLRGDGRHEPHPLHPRPGRRRELQRAQGAGRPARGHHRHPRRQGGQTVCKPPVDPLWTPCCNVLKDLVDPLGGTIDIRAVKVGGPSVDRLRTPCGPPVDPLWATTQCLCWTFGAPSTRRTTPCSSSPTLCLSSRASASGSASPSPSSVSHPLYTPSTTPPLLHPSTTPLYYTPSAPPLQYAAHGACSWES